MRPGPVVALGLVIGLAGCAVWPGRTALPIVPPDGLRAQALQGCGAPELGPVVGQPFTVLAEYRLPGHLRVLRPAQGVTRDLMPSRLNAQVDEAGVILRLFCG